MVHKAIPIAVGVVGVVLVLLSTILGWVVVPKIIDKKIEEEVRLIPGTETWDKWADITLPIQIKFYIFEVTNGEDVMLGAYPILKEHGPYIYNEKRAKENLTVTEEGKVITYRQPIIYTFNEEDSVGPESDEFDILNVALISVMSGVADAGDSLGEQLKKFLLQATGLHMAMCRETIIRKVSVKDLFFNGYDVSCYFSNAVLASILRDKAEFANQRFGLYNGKNGMDDGIYEIDSGVADSSTFGKIITWAPDSIKKPDSYLGYWNKTGDRTCDMINGTDGSIFPPFVEKILRVFVTDLCRSVYLTYVEETEFFDIKGYRFSIPRDMLEDPKINLDNACFCLFDVPSECPGAGALDVSVCREGAPIVMSAPYFLDGDEKYIRHLEGISPDRQKHATFMDLEPNSGVLLRAQKRLQVNIHTSNYRKYNVSGFNDLREMLAFPLIWVEENASIDQESADDLKDKLLKPLKIVNISKWTVLGVGIFLTVGGIGWIATMLLGKH